MLVMNMWLKSLNKCEWLLSCAHRNDTLITQMFLPLFRGYKSRLVCRDLQQPITVTRNLIDAVNVRTTEEAEPAAWIH